MVRRQGATREYVVNDLRPRSNAGAGPSRVCGTQPFGPRFSGPISASLARPVSQRIRALRLLLEIRPNSMRRLASHTSYTTLKTMAQRSNHKLRIGIVGAGGIVRTRHLPALKKHPDAEIVAVSNSTYESSEKFCNENCPQATPMRNWADLLAVPDLDIIWIGTPPYMHSAV